MKHLISFNTWEKKKDLIIQLYREEGWPLKQVIKRVRSHDFNPSESQLRSRLKKWCITKSSRRQVRQKSLMNQHGADFDGTYSFAQTALNGVLNTEINVSTGKAGPTARNILPNGCHLSQVPTIPSTSPLHEYHGTSPAYSS
ncbi:hypothetical protein ETB97_003994, partial [Aspergillus alliaceus]